MQWDRTTSMPVICIVLDTNIIIQRIALYIYIYIYDYIQLN